MGTSRKNAADIKMAVDAMEMAFERDYISTFVLCTGDSDFTPLVHKLRELNKRVIGVGVAGVRRVSLLRPARGRRRPATAHPAPSGGASRRSGGAAVGPGS
jgi:hypothetical protein